jgi:dihydrodipicolinate synthase/N-acetylneuraminate lyase
MVFTDQDQIDEEALRQNIRSYLEEGFKGSRPIFS